VGLGALLMDDPLGVHKLVGGGLVVAGIALIVLKFGKQRPTRA